MRWSIGGGNGGDRRADSVWSLPARMVWYPWSWTVRKFLPGHVDRDSVTRLNCEEQPLERIRHTLFRLRFVGGVRAIRPC